MGLSGRIGVTVAASVSAAAGLSTAEHAVNENLSFNIVDGILTKQFNVMYDEEISLGAGATITKDLTTLLNGIGGAALLAKVRGMLFIADAGNDGNITIGDAATFPFTGPLTGTTPKVVLGAEAVALFLDWKTGWAVTNGANDNLKFANSGAATGKVRVVILGTNA